MRLSTGYFGIFVITAAISAAGTLGLPDMSLSAFLPADLFGSLTGDPPEAAQYQRLLNIVPGVIPSPFVAMFGIPAILGLTLGQFVASTTSPLGPISLYSPLVTLVALFFIYLLRKRSVILGALVFTAVTTLWISFSELLVFGTQIASTFPLAFLAQLAPIIVGYIAYVLAKSSNIFRTEAKSREEERRILA
ncbi:MAG: hypothetical protein ACE1ZC_03725 [Nitrososphaerales archaeon]